MKTARKGTIEIPDALLRKAQKASGKGITATVRKGLELVAACRAYESLRAFRGTVKLSVDVEPPRDDRS